jgi:hypothetical protein
MIKYECRQEAIRRYLTNEKVSKICKSLKKSRKWFYTWLKRYQTKTNEKWFEDYSKAPKKITKKLDADTEQKILLIRQDLMNEKMAQIGAISIQYEFEKRCYKPLPNIWSINRVISKHNLTKESSKKVASQNYPVLFYHTHQMDLVGPRYIKGDGSFYSVNIIDVTNHICHTQAIRTKGSNNIVNALANFWKMQGMPDALQIDNELSFRGSNRYPRSFGAVIRFALSQGIAVVFIPVAEPWRNGMIEKFNDNYQRHFLKAYTFSNLVELQQKEQIFINFHNQNHRYSSQKSATPNEQKAQQLEPILYNQTIHLPNLKNEINIPLKEGNIYYIRYIRSDLKLSLNNDFFIVKECLKYSYIVAQISIEKQRLFIWQNYQLIETFEYTINAVEW